jgi:hypothetical protein
MLSMDFQEGDIQLLNNHVTVHAREAFVDHGELGRQRHVLRMWITVDDTRRRPLSGALDGALSVGPEGRHPGKAAVSTGPWLPARHPLHESFARRTPRMIDRVGPSYSVAFNTARATSDATGRPLRYFWLACCFPCCTPWS